MLNRAELGDFRGRLSEIRSRLRRATIGPWVARLLEGTSGHPRLYEIRARSSSHAIAQLGVDPSLEEKELAPNLEPDTDFIVNAGTDIEFLLQTIEILFDLTDSFTRMTLSREDLLKEETEKGRQRLLTILGPSRG